MRLSSKKRHPLELFALLAVLALLSAGLAGCGAANVDWATPTGGPAQSSRDEVQTALDTYAQALVDKDQAKFDSVIDQTNPVFAAKQRDMFTRMAAIPFARYKVEVSSQSETAPGTAVVKVNTSYTLKDSFSELADAERSAFLMVKKDDGWKLAGDATADALGKDRNARLEDFAPVEIISSDNIIVLYHPGQESVAQSVLEKAQTAMPQLQATIPDAQLPKVPVRVFDSKEQIELAFPGQWQDWAGGAARALGSSPGQGGEIIIDAELYQTTGSRNPGYNGTMLAHELTHVALFPKGGARTPPFLIEGMADYVGGIQPVNLLPAKLKSGEPFSPQLKDIYQPGGFSALLSTEAATLAYEESDTAVDYLEKKYGNEKVLALLDEFKRREDEQIDQQQLVDEVFRSQLGVSWNDFENGWRAYVTGGSL